MRRAHRGNFAYSELLPSTSRAMAILPGLENIMRTFMWALALCCCAPCAAGAAEKPAQAVELQDFKGQYDLADGRTLTVTERRKTLYAQMNGGPSVELEAAGKGVFNTRWGGMRIEFDQRDNGSVAGVKLLGPDQMVARSTR